MERYRLADLAQETGTTTRTIRFYVAEGLLLPPVGAGPAAVYNRDHLERLRLIALLKTQYLPLKEIRRVLASLSREQVRERLDQHAVPPLEAAAAASPPSASGGPLDDAGAYLDRILGERWDAKSSGGDDDVAFAVREPFPRASAPPPPSARPRAAPRDDDREQWERITLADGVELHIRDDWRRTVGPLEALIRQARKLLGSE